MQEAYCFFVVGVAHGAATIVGRRVVFVQFAAVVTNSAVGKQSE